MPEEKAITFLNAFSKYGTFYASDFDIANPLISDRYSPKENERIKRIRQYIVDNYIENQGKAIPHPCGIRRKAGRSQIKVRKNVGRVLQTHEGDGIRKGRRSSGLVRATP